MMETQVRASAGKRSLGSTALTWTGVIHTLFGPLAYGSVLAALVADGVFNSVGSAEGPARDAALWFLVTGVLFILLGRMAAAVHRATGALPRFLGWSVIGIAVVVGVLMPASGWPLVALSGVALLAGRQAAGTR